MKFPYHYWWAAGIFLILLGTLDGIVSGWSDAAASGLITSGIIIIIILLGKGIRMEEGPRQDERTRKIGAWGLSYSWFLVFVTLFVLFWVQYLGLLALNVQNVVLFLVLEMAASARIFQWHFFHKGDIE